MTGFFHVLTMRSIRMFKLDEYRLPCEYQNENVGKTGFAV